MAKPVKPATNSGRQPVKQVLVEEPVTAVPDVPGEKPQAYKFKDWASI